MENYQIDAKKIVQEKYGEIANQSKTQNQSSCCGSANSCCGGSDYTVFSDNYASLKGYNPDADLGLGCGLPTEFAGIGNGDSVLDLGSGAGNDCFVARALTGETGKVTGLDFTDEMIEKARTNVQKLGFDNIEFIKGDIEDMPLDDVSFDVVISNCVLNLVPDKRRAFKEIYRVLKDNGHFCISDIVVSGKLPEKLLKDAEMYAGCVSGALLIDEYLEIIKQTGFSQIEIKKQKPVELPENLLLKYLDPEELQLFKNKSTGLFSITVTAHK